MVADAYEAMTNDRAYRAALSAEEARSELVDGVGSQFDGDVVKTFLHTLRHEPVTPPSRGDDDRAGQVPSVGA